MKKLVNAVCRICQKPFTYIRKEWHQIRSTCSTKCGREAFQKRGRTDWKANETKIKFTCPKKQGKMK